MSREYENEEWSVAATVRLCLWLTLCVIALNLQVRVVDRPLQISQKQLNLIEMMISEMRDPVTCKLSTVGSPRNDGSGYVDVNRPLQRRNDDHDLIYCDSGDWSE